MLFSEENQLIYKLYSDLLLENPDTLTIGGNHYDYADRSLGNITGAMTDSGKFIMSKSLIGHYDLFEAISDRNLEDVRDLTHNFSSIEEIYGIHRNNWQKIRIWPKFKVFSFWMKRFEPKYKPAVDAILSSLGDGSRIYKFDLRLHDDKFIGYDELVNTPLSDEDKEEMSEDARRKVEDQRRLADFMLGNDRKRSIDLDIMSNKKPEWMRREGD